MRSKKLAGKIAKRKARLTVRRDLKVGRKVLKKTRSPMKAIKAVAKMHGNKVGQTTYRAVRSSKGRRKKSYGRSRRTGRRMRRRKSRRY